MRFQVTWEGGKLNVFRGGGQAGKCFGHLRDLKKEKKFPL